MPHINLVTATDDTYAQHAGVMLYSAFANAHPATTFSVYILDGGISEGNKGKLARLAEKFSHSISYLSPEASSELLKIAPVTDYFKVVTYYRLFLDELLPSSVTRFMYLDPDIVVRCNLENMLKLASMTGISAVEDVFATEHTSIKVLENGYFNAGVMVVDREFWSRSNVVAKAHEIISSKTPLMFVDQDILNSIFGESWHHLPLKYNVMSYFLQADFREKIHALLGGDPRVILRKPSIIHYTGYDKPWLFRSNRPHKLYYYLYLWRTPWKWYFPDDLRRVNFKKAIIEKFTPDPMLDAYDRMKKTIKRKITLH